MTTPVEPPAPKKRISGAWYALTALPWIVAIGVWYVHLPRVIAGFTSLGSMTFSSHVETSAEANSQSEPEFVMLHAGDNTIYVEGDKIGETTRARTDLACVLLDDAGKPVPLERDTSTSMTLNSDSYVSQYELRIERVGEYALSCSSAIAARYSIGRSFPIRSIVWMILALVGALPVMGIIGYTISRIRNPPRPKTPVATMPTARAL